MTAGSDTPWLAAFLATHGGCAGSVHRVRGSLLQATAFLGIPPQVQALTATIPAGKGMAGLAWSRGVPVATCDLPTDASGDVQPGAKAVLVHGAVALPVVDGLGAVRAVVGIAFETSQAPDDAALLRAAAALPEP